MTDPELPPDLAALERRLIDRPHVAPSSDLDRRVLRATRNILNQPAGPASDGWRFWAAVAAAVLLGINLSMSMAANTDWRLTAHAEPGQLAATVERLRALAPELSEAELRRQALLTRAGAGLTPTVPVAPNWQYLRNIKEHDGWDVR